MMTLRSLNKQALRSLTRAFQHGVEDCFQSLFDARCAKILSHCRDLCFLPHLLNLQCQWKDVTVQDLANKCQLSTSLFTSDASDTMLDAVLRQYTISESLPLAPPISASSQKEPVC